MACPEAKLRLSQNFWAWSDPLESREFAHLKFDDLMAGMREKQAFEWRFRFECSTLYNPNRYIQLNLDFTDKVLIFIGKVRQVLLAAEEVVES